MIRLVDGQLMESKLLIMEVDLFLVTQLNQALPVSCISRKQQLQTLTLNHQQRINHKYHHQVVVAH